MAAARTASRASAISPSQRRWKAASAFVAALVGQRGQVGEQRRDVLGVEHREPQRLVALEHEVAGRVAQPGEPHAHALGGGEAVQAALGGLLREVGDHAASDRGAVLQERGGRAAEPLAEPPPVVAELAPGGVQLAQRAVLRAVHAGAVAQRYRPGSHSGSSPALAPRERMKSRSESRLR